MNHKNYLMGVVCLFFGATTTINGQAAIELALISDGFSSPVDITHAGDERLFIVEKEGKIQISSKDGVVNETPFLDITDRVSNNASERGLLGLAFHPDYAVNGYFYVNYTDEGGDTNVSRFSVSADNADVADKDSEAILFEVEQPRGNHNAGDLCFGPDGLLYFGLGDGGGAGDLSNYAQTRQSFLGKMIRINVDSGAPYAIPSDNPYVNDDETLDEIWALGLRNPWRISFDRLTGDLWIADVGQNGYEEISVQPANSKGGENYGWRCFEGTSTFRNGDDCPAASASVLPIYEYAHYGLACGGSITGGFVYRGQEFMELQGKYFFAEYCTGEIFMLETGENESVSVERVLEGPVLAWSSFGEDNNGELYVASIEGSISKIKPLNTTSLDSAQNTFGIKILENPIRNLFQFEILYPQSSFALVRIVDQFGRTVYQKNRQFNPSTPVEVATEHWASGVYHLTVTVGEHRVQRQLVKQ